MAGQRKGLDGNRSGLWFEFHRILDELRPGLCVIENVPGLLSSNKGRDFEIVLSGLVELGYCVAWRILDSRYFGVAQRRRRVFIVGSLGNGRSAQILFEPESLRGNSEKGREARKAVAGTIKGGSGERGWSDPSDGNGGGLISMALKAGGSAKNEPDDETYIPVADTLAANGGGMNRPAGNCNETDFLVAKPLLGSNQRNDEETETMVAIPINEVAANPSNQHGVGTGMQVRRLTPTECERLQGFPDGHTEGYADSTRYKMMGNAVTVSVAEWIGKRIAEAAE